MPISEQKVAQKMATERSKITNKKRKLKCSAVFRDSP